MSPDSSIDSFATNLMVTDVAASLRFYRDVVGASVAFCVDADQNTDDSGEILDGCVFASVRAGSSELMLQERASLLEDSPAFGPDTQIGASATLYFRVSDVDAVAARLPADTPIVKPLETTWYGMREIWIQDPDGYVLTLGTPHGPPPS